MPYKKNLGIVSKEDLVMEVSMDVIDNRTIIHLEMSCGSLVTQEKEHTKRNLTFTHIL